MSFLKWKKLNVSKMELGWVHDQNSHDTRKSNTLSHKMEMCETQWEIFARLPNAFLFLRFSNFIMSPKFGTKFGDQKLSKLG
jgi:hypothetical protein